MKIGVFPASLSRGGAKKREQDPTDSLPKDDEDCQCRSKMEGNLKGNSRWIDPQKSFYEKKVGGTGDGKKFRQSLENP